MLYLSTRKQVMYKIYMYINIHNEQSYYINQIINKYPHDTIYIINNIPDNIMIYHLLISCFTNARSGLFILSISIVFIMYLSCGFWKISLYSEICCIFEFQISFSQKKFVRTRHGFVLVLFCNNLF